MKRKQVSIHETKTHLSRLLHEVAEGAEIIIAHGNSPVAKLIRFEPPHLKRVAGLSKGKVTMSEDFDQPLEDFGEYQ